MSLTSVCKGCPDRHTACWGECEKYQAARAEFEKEKAAIKQQRYAEHATKSVLFRNRRYVETQKERWAK